MPIPFYLFCLAMLCGCQEASVKRPSQVMTHRPRSPLTFLGTQKTLWPSHFSFERLRGLVAEGALKEASRYINGALQISPRHAALHLVNGFVYEEMGRCGDHSRKELIGIAYRTATALDSSQWLSSYLLGCHEMHEQKYAEAQEHLADALILRPNDPDILYALTYCSYYIQDLPVALSSVHRLVSLFPKNPAFLRTASMVYAAAGDHALAKAHLDRYAACVGQGERDVQCVAQRLQQWRTFHGDSAAVLRVSDESAGEGAMLRGSNGPVVRTEKFNRNKEDGARGQGEAEEENPLDQASIVIDVVVIRISDYLTTGKGGNILESLEIGLGGGATLATVGRTLTRVTNSGMPAQPVSGTWAKAFNFQVTNESIGYGLNIANIDDSYVEVGSRPSIATLLHKPAYFLQGDQYTGAAAGSTGSAIASVDSGTKVEVTPLEITKDGLIVLQITVTGSLFTNPPDVNRGVSDQVLSISRSKVDTFVKAYFGQTIMLGGVQSELKIRSKRGFPGLSDIPFVQYFFGREQTFWDKRSVLFLLTPRLGGVAPKCNTNFAKKRDGLTTGERLKKRGFMAFGEYSNMYYFHKMMTKSNFFFQFRSNDIPLPFYGYYTSSLSKKLDQLRMFLWY
jgi:hypothetical protein